MNVVFVAAGPYSWGSSRMRAYWVAEKMGATVVQFGQPLPDADVYVWQKLFDIEFIKAHQDKRHYWDVCDPMWWFSPAEIDDLLPHLAGVVCSTQALADDLKKWAGPPLCPPVHHIPDRLNLGYFPIKRQPRPLQLVRFIWYGIAVNRVALHGALINLARLHANGRPIELTVMDEKPDVQLGRFDFPIYYTPWALDKENAVIAAHDIALLPPYPGEWGAVKSNNKSVTAWACGLSTIDGLNYNMLEAMLGHVQKGNEYVPDVAEKYDVALSAREWEAIVCLS